MKKQLLTGAFLLASLFAAQAQILTNDFGTDQASFTAAMEDWSTDNPNATGGDGITFEFFTNNPDPSTLGFTGVSAFSSNFTGEGADAQEVDVFNFLLTPMIDLTDVETAYLSFKVGVFDGTEGAIGGYQIIGILEDEYQANNFDNIFVVGQGTLDVNTSETVNLQLDPVAGEQIRLFITHTAIFEEGAVEGDAPITTGLVVLQFDDIVVAEGTAGVKENVLANLSVYPNPASDVVNVTVDALVSNVAIVDLNGRTVKSVKFDAVSTATVNVSDLASGVYMMTVSSDKGTTTKKIVKN